MVGQDRLELDEDQVTMLRGTAMVEWTPVKVNIDLRQAEAIITTEIDGHELAYQVEVAISPWLRHAVNTSKADFIFYIGKHLRCPDYGIRVQQQDE